MMLVLRRNKREIYVKKLSHYEGTATIFFSKKEKEELNIYEGEWLFELDRYNFISRLRKHRKGLQFTFPKKIYEFLKLNEHSFIGLEVDSWKQRIRLHVFDYKMENKLSEKWKRLCGFN